MCENYDVVRSEGLLPIGIAEGCTLKRDILKDEPIRADDVEYPSGQLVHALRREQDLLFPG
jgi:predicted homoserine dehydrogenase-like protein